MADNGMLLEELKEIMGVTKGIANVEASYPTPREVCSRTNFGSLDIVSEAVLSQIAEMSWNEIAPLATLSLISEENLAILCYAHTQGTSVFREGWRDMKLTGCLSEGIDRGVFLSAVRNAPDARVMTRTARLARVVLGEAGGGIKAAVAKAFPMIHSIFTGDGGVEDGDCQGETPKARAYKEKGKQITKDHMTPRRAGQDGEVMNAPHFVNTKDQKAYRKTALGNIEKIIDQMTRAAAATGKHPEEMFGMKWRDIHREKTRYS